MDINFKLVGHWHLILDNIFVAEEINYTQCLYAFSINQKKPFAYIGLTKRSAHNNRTVYGRMQNIRYASSKQAAKGNGKTNYRLQGEIKSALEGGSTIEIYVHLPDNGVNLYELKKQLIRDFDPPWNRQHKR